MNKLTICLLLITVTACRKKDDAPAPAKTNTIPEFFAAAAADEYGKNQPVFSLIAGEEHGLDDPQDLDFNPFREGELWIINKGIPETGGTTVMLSNAGTPQQTFDKRKDGNAWHFMSLPSAISFSNNGNWATSSAIMDANHSGGTFAGPTLWSSDLNIYARPSGGNGSHMDMLHGSPYSMGIEAERDNIFWVYDSYHQHIVRYDFQQDHGPGNDDHSDGKIHRYTQAKITRNKSNLPSHIVLDKEKKWLYVVDGGNKRIFRMDIRSGNQKSNLPLINEPLAEHWEMENVVTELVISSGYGLDNPCGIEINGNRLFVSEYNTGEILCFDIGSKELLGKISTGKPGIIGIKLDRHGKLWYVNALTSEVYRVDPR